MSNYILKTSYIRRDDSNVCFVLDQYAYSDFHRNSSLKQQSADRNVALLAQIILIMCQPVFTLTP